MKLEAIIDKKKNLQVLYFKSGIMFILVSWAQNMYILT